MIRVAILGAGVVLVLICGTVFGQGAKFNRMVEVGQPAPRWSDLAGTDGGRHGFDDYRDARLLVVVFTRNQCPVASAYEERLVGLADEYRGQGVVIAAVNAAVGPAETLEKMKERAGRRKFPFDYLHDPTQQTARQYGVTATPQVFVLDRDRKVAYMGAFDDNARPEKAGRHYVREAIEALLADRRPEITESRPFGCRLEYEPQ